MNDLSAASTGGPPVGGPDPDPLETREWTEALDGVIEREGPERAAYLLRALLDRAPVADLTGFMAAVAGLPDGAAVRLDLRDLDDRPRVATLKLDLDSWPAARLDRGPNGWVRTPVL